MYMLISTVLAIFLFLYVFAKYCSYRTLGFENLDYIFREYIEYLAIKSRNEENHEIKVILRTY